MQPKHIFASPGNIQFSRSFGVLRLSSSLFNTVPYRLITLPVRDVVISTRSLTDFWKLQRIRTADDLKICLIYLWQVRQGKPCCIW